MTVIPPDADVLRQTPLGRTVKYPQRLDATLLCPIPRAVGRAVLGLKDALPFSGEDRWRAYEVSWLDRRGKPEVAMAEFTVPADSPALIESKSLKLYLNSWSDERVDDASILASRIAEDLAATAGAEVGVQLRGRNEFSDASLAPPPGCSLDAQPVDILVYGPPQPALLRCQSDVHVEEMLYSDLFRCNCPVTGQPDWATVCITYRGPQLDHAGLLAYLVSFRGHAGFHEECVERIFLDLLRIAQPAELQVAAFFTRRGGLDINPLRWLHSRSQLSFPRLPRQ